VSTTFTWTGQINSFNDPTQLYTYMRDPGAETLLFLVNNGPYRSSSLAARPGPWSCT
jgi:hypothetical protein